METRLFSTSTLLRRSRKLRYPIRKPTLLKLVQDKFVDHAIRPGRGQGKGRAGLWTDASLRQVTVWCRFRKAELRDDRLAFAMWWETGNLTPGVRDFLRRILRLLEVMVAGVVYRGYRPRSAQEKMTRVRRYSERTEPPDLLPIVDALGEHGAEAEFGVLAGLLGLFEVKEPLGVTLQKLAPLWAGLSTPPPPKSIDSMMQTIRPHLKTLAVLAYSLAPHLALSKIHGAIDEATDEDLSEARAYLRWAAAGTLRLGGALAYYRRIRKFLTAASKVFRAGALRGQKLPRWTKRFQDVYTWEGLLAFATLVSLRVRQTKSEIDPGLSMSESNSVKEAGVRNENGQGE